MDELSDRGSTPLGSTKKKRQISTRNLSFYFGLQPGEAGGIDSVLLLHNARIGTLYLVRNVFAVERARCKIT